jgi:hypothetical protein
MNELNHKILYAFISPNIDCKGIERILLNGVIVEKARLTPVG